MGQLVLVAGIALTTYNVLCAMPSTLFGANLPATPLDLGPDLCPLAQQYKLPGLVGAILYGGQIVAIGSTGVRKLGHPAPFFLTDSIPLGSDTKALYSSANSSTKSSSPSTQQWPRSFLISLLK